VGVFYALIPPPRVAAPRNRPLKDAIRGHAKGVACIPSFFTRLFAMAFINGLV